MKTKLWHIGLASAILGSAGLAHAQTSPTSGFSQNLESVESPSNTSSGSASDGYNGPASIYSSPSWDSNPELNQAPADVSDVPPADSLASVNERGDQGVQGSDGMLVPPAFSGTGFNDGESSR